MKKLVILLTDAMAPASEFMETLGSAGFSVLLKDFSDIRHKATTAPKASSALKADGKAMPRLVAVLYEVPRETSPEGLRLVAAQAKSWSGVPIVACRTNPDRASRGSYSPDDQTLKRLGFDLVADSPAQLPAVLRQVEDGSGTGELKLPEGFKSNPESRAFLLPDSVRSRQLRGAFALLASLHLATNQKEAARAAVAGVVRLVSANHWAIFLATRTSNAAEVEFEQLVGRDFAEAKRISFDEAWQSELVEVVDSPDMKPSLATREAATTIKPIRRLEEGRRVVALPLVYGERVLGVLEGIRLRAGARSFSQNETAFLTALTIPIASSLANSVRIAEAERSSLTDDLTRLHNARYLRQFLVNEIKRARRYGAMVAALFLDLDDFKRVNDVHGHLIGSHALMEVAAVILPSVRDTDCVVRYGGDEFVIILPDTGVEEAIQVAERIRMKIERHEFTGGRRLKVALTASLGIAVFPQHALSPRQLIVSADRAMYQAKAAQKNCVRVIDDEATDDKDGASVTHSVGPSQFQRIPDEKLIS
jgi:diguanylate cyclase (GGDEF)-like protein